MKNSILYIIVFSFLLVACNKSEVAVKEEVAMPTSLMLSKKQSANVGVKWAVPTEVLLPQTIVLSGVIDVPPQNVTTLSSVFPGFVTGLKVYYGTNVTKGEILCYLEHPEILNAQKQYYNALLSLNLAVKDEARQSELFAQNAGSAKKLELAKEAQLLAKQRVLALESNLANAGISVSEVAKGNFTSKIAIKAPHSAFVKSVNITENEQVGAGKELFTLMDKSHVHLELACTAAQAAVLKEGTAIQFFPGGDRNKPTKASLYLSGKMVEQGSGLVNLHAHLENEHTELLPGTAGDAIAFISEQRLLAVPAEAVVEADGISYVFEAIENGDTISYNLIPVKLGPETNNYFPVLGKLKGKIVISNADILYAELTKSLEEEE
jgi:cobalt-zinc-cadmium efflux system membrane fusion protein